MPTISDLVREHSKVPGDIRVRRQSNDDRNWRNDQWFRPYFPHDEYWCGKVDEALPCSFLNDSDRGESGASWQLYTEPKPKLSPLELAYTLYDAIAHGDEKHRFWLRQKIEDHFGIKLPPIVIEPKAKVMRAQYAVQRPHQETPISSLQWFKDDAEFLKCWNIEDGTTYDRLEERAFIR